MVGVKIFKLVDKIYKIGRGGVLGEGVEVTVETGQQMARARDRLAHP